MSDVPLVEVRLLGLPLKGRALFNRHVEGLLRELALVQIGASRAQSTLPQRLLRLAAELDTTYAGFRAGPDAVLDEAAAAGEEFYDVTYAVPETAGPYVRRVLDVLEEADRYCRSERHLLTLPAPGEVVAYRRWYLGEFVRQLEGAAPRPWHGPLLRDPDDLEPALGADGPGAAGGTDPGGSDARAEHDGEVDGQVDGQVDGEVVGDPLLLDPVANTVSAARRYVRSLLEELGAAHLEECAELGVSELVTNAMLHARTAFSVAVRTMPSGRVRIEVGDSSPVPVQPRSYGLEATTGRGLRLLASLSHDWGIAPLPEGDGPGKVVWFEPRESIPEDHSGEDWAAELEGLV